MGGAHSQSGQYGEVKILGAIQNTYKPKGTANSGTCINLVANSGRRHECVKNIGTARFWC
jgi:hypothetical protein